MTVDEIKALLTQPEYSFLRDNTHLGDKIIFLTLGGSHAYGTNNENSDVDIRGCALSSPSDLIGMTNFEQVISNATDTTVYSFNKLVSLLVNCNPNVIELLGCKPEHYFYITDIGQEMINNRELFLSQRAASSFGGYATQQLRRLENALARDKLPQADKERHLEGALNRALKAFDDMYAPTGKNGIELFIDDSPRDDLDKEVFCNIHLDHYPAREFNILLNQLHNVLGTYEKLNHRNRKKDDEHLNKHAMHLIRLYMMCLDILEREEIVTYREADREFLLSIRNGAYQKEDGTYRSEFFDMVADYEKRLAYAKENTSLPAHPNMKKIEEFVMSVNRRALDL